MVPISAYTKQTLIIIISLMVILVIFPFYKFFYGNQLTFSTKPGYYDSPFYLSILGGKEGTIHYTLDGSEPTVDDPVFDRKNPLYIEDATNHPNVYSMKTDTSTGFLPNISRYTADILPYTVPAYNVDKCTVIRASLFNSTGTCLDSITGTYFIGFQKKDAYQDIYTASIVTSPENLFDDDIGIYVTGSILNQFLENELATADLFTACNTVSWDGNYANRGADWEREAHITLFDNQQTMIFSQKCGIRIKGNISRAMLPKSISCYAREIYNDSNRFHTNIFDLTPPPHKFVLFAGGNDTCFKLTDYLANTMERNLRFATMDFIPCAMFLDGEYWGVYYITEDYNADYVHDHYQVASDNIIMIKNGILEEGTDADYQTYEEMLAFIHNHDMTVTANYNKACDLIDIESFIDYYAAQIYIARHGDWPRDNIELWRARENDGSRYGDGKWRWMLFDVNSYGSMSIQTLPHDTLSSVLTDDYIFPSLYQNENFRRQFAERLLYIGKETFAPEKCNLFIDQYVQTMKEPLAASNMRFYMDDKSDEFEQYVTDMRTFFEQRYDVVWDFIVQDMGEEWLAQNKIQK